MRFGVHLPTCWDDYGDTPIHVAIEQIARVAEELNFDGVWANDAVIFPPTQGMQIIEPLVTLASLVHSVPRLALGTSVLVLPQRNAMLVAKQVAALDILSQHRLILGVGIGHRPEEFELLGADYASRGAMTDEQIEVLRTLWREPIANYTGRFHRFDGVSLLPHPANGGPPVWIGGNTQGAIRRVARYGDGWLPFHLDLDDFRSGVSMLRKLTQERRTPTIGNEFLFRIERPKEPNPILSTVPWAPSKFTGNPAAVAQYLDAYRQEGLEYALIAFESEDVDDVLRQMRLFAEEVMPQFVA